MKKAWEDFRRALTTFVAKSQDLQEPPDVQAENDEHDEAFMGYLDMCAQADEKLENFEAARTDPDQERTNLQTARPRSCRPSPCRRDGTRQCWWPTCITGSYGWRICDGWPD